MKICVIIPIFEFVASSSLAERASCCGVVNINGLNGVYDNAEGTYNLQSNNYNGYGYYKQSTSNNYIYFASLGNWHVSDRLGRIDIISNFTRSSLK